MWSRDGFDRHSSGVAIFPGKDPCGMQNNQLHAWKPHGYAPPSLMPLEHVVVLPLAARGLADALPQPIASRAGHSLPPTTPKEGRAVRLLSSPPDSVVNQDGWANISHTYPQDSTSPRANGDLLLQVDKVFKNSTCHWVLAFLINKATSKMRWTMSSTTWCMASSTLGRRHRW